MKKGKVIPFKPRKKAPPVIRVKVYDYAKGWRDLSRKARIMYAWGMKDGFTQGSFDTLKAYEQERGDTFPRRRTIEHKAIDVVCLDPKALADKITQLYRNPLYKTLSFQVICAGALSILEGAPQKEVEKDLKVLVDLHAELPEPTE